MSRGYSGKHSIRKPGSRGIHAGLVAVALAGTGLIGAGSAQALPIKMLTAGARLSQQRRELARNPSVVPPAPPCPENGLIPIESCLAAPETSVIFPTPTNMTYHGGPVEVRPRVYLVLWGWGRKGAFPGRTCKRETFREGSISATLGCDPDGAGRYMADMIQQMGGTNWAGISTQYYETTGGSKRYIRNDRRILAGIWTDNSADGANLSRTSGSKPPGPTNTQTALATEAQRAVRHFRVRRSALPNAQFIIAQPPGFTEGDAAAGGYCAFHDYTMPHISGGVYNSIERGIAYTDMPYQLLPAISTGCGTDSVNRPPAGRLDAFSETLGHEIEETITDPGAEDVVGSATTGGETYYGGWYDAADVDENGDKCADVGYSPLAGAGGTPVLYPIPGAFGNIKGDAGERFAMQSLWSNAAAAGTGWCAGVRSTDLPGPLAGEPPY